MSRVRAVFVGGHIFDEPQSPFFQIGGKRLGEKAKCPGLADARLTIAGLKGRISVFEDRLKLAAKQAESARQAKDEVATEFATCAWRISCNILGVTEEADSGQFERGNVPAERQGRAARPAESRRTRGSSTPLAGAPSWTWSTNRRRSLAGDDDRLEHLRPPQLA